MKKSANTFLEVISLTLCKKYFSFLCVFFALSSLFEIEFSEKCEKFAIFRFTHENRNKIRIYSGLLRVGYAISFWVISVLKGCGSFCPPPTIQIRVKNRLLLVYNVHLSRLKFLVRESYINTVVHEYKNTYKSLPHLYLLYITINV